MLRKKFKRVLKIVNPIRNLLIKAFLYCCLGAASIGLGVKVVHLIGEVFTTICFIDVAILVLTGTIMVYHGCSFFYQWYLIYVYGETRHTLDSVK